MSFEIDVENDCPDFMQMRKKDNSNYRNFCKEQTKLISAPYLDKLAYFIIMKSGDRYEEEVRVLQKWTSQFKFFSDLNSKSCNIASRVHEKCCTRIKYETIKKGSQVFMAGDAPDKFYIILSGEVNVLLQKTASVLQNEIGIAEETFRMSSQKDQTNSIQQRVQNIIKQRQIIKKMEELQKIRSQNGELISDFNREIAIKKLIQKGNNQLSENSFKLSDSGEYHNTNIRYCNSIQHSPLLNGCTPKNERNQTEYVALTPRQYQHRSRVFADQIKDYQQLFLENSCDSIFQTDQSDSHAHRQLHSSYSRENNQFCQQQQKSPTQSLLNSNRTDYSNQISPIFEVSPKSNLNDYGKSVSNSFLETSKDQLNKKDDQYINISSLKNSQHQSPTQQISVNLNENSFILNNSQKIENQMLKKESTNESTEIEPYDFQNDPIYVGLGRIKLEDLKDPELFIQNGVLTHKFLLTLKQGQMFGELGLLMKKPRAATILVKEDTELATLNAAEYISILQEGEMRKFNRRINFFQSSLMQNCGRDIVVKFAYNFQKLHFEKGQVIYKQGDIAQYVYLIKKGLVQIQKQITGNSEGENQESTFMKSHNKQRLMTLKINDFSQGQSFGEIEVLQDIPRDNTAICLSQKASIYVLSVKNFLTLLQENKFLVKGFLNLSNLKEKFQENREKEYNSCVNDQIEKRKIFEAKMAQSEKLSCSIFEKNLDSPRYLDPIFKDDGSKKDLQNLDQHFNTSQYSTSKANNFIKNQIKSPYLDKNDSFEFISENYLDSSHGISNMPKNQTSKTNQIHDDGSPKIQQPRFDYINESEDKTHEYFNNNAYVTYVHALTEAKAEKLKNFNLSQNQESPKNQANLIFDAMIECQEIRKESSRPYPKNAISKPNIRMKKILLQPGVDVKETINKSLISTPSFQDEHTQSSSKTKKNSFIQNMSFSTALERLSQKGDFIIDNTSQNEIINQGIYDNNISNQNQMKRTAKLSPLTTQSLFYSQDRIQPRCIAIDLQQNSFPKKSNKKVIEQKRVMENLQIQGFETSNHSNTSLQKDFNNSSRKQIKENHLNNHPIFIQNSDRSINKTEEKDSIKNYKNNYFVKQGIKTSCHTNFHSLSERKVPKQSHLSQVNLSVLNDFRNRDDTNLAFCKNNFPNKLQTHHTSIEKSNLIDSFRVSTNLSSKILSSEGQQKISAEQLFRKFKILRQNNNIKEEQLNLSELLFPLKLESNYSEQQLNSIEQKQILRACRQQKQTSKHNFFRNKLSKLYIIDRYQQVQESDIHTQSSPSFSQQQNQFIRNQSYDRS